MRPVFSVKSMLIAVFAAAVAIAVITHVRRQLDAKVRDGYSQQIVVTLLIKFMEENDGNWPKNWTDLQSLYEREQHDLKRGTFEELRQRVYVDFSVDIQQMTKDATVNENPRFRVIYAKFTSGFHPIGEPNSTVHNYLRGKATKENKGASHVPTADSVD